MSNIVSLICPDYPRQNELPKASEEPRVITIRKSVRIENKGIGEKMKMFNKIASYSPDLKSKRTLSSKPTNIGIEDFIIFCVSFV